LVNMGDKYPEPPLHGDSYWLYRLEANVWTSVPAKG